MDAITFHEMIRRDAILVNKLPRSEDVIMTNKKCIGTGSLCSLYDQENASKGQKILYNPSESDEGRQVSTRSVQNCNLKEIQEMGQITVLNAIPGLSTANFFMQIFLPVP